jgi:hypothetical protein
VALALLSIVPSEAAVERSFSMQDSIHTKKRNRLSDDSINAEMFIRFNNKAFDSTPNHQGNYLELTDKNVEQANQELYNVFPAEEEEGVVHAQEQYQEEKEGKKEEKEEEMDEEKKKEKETNKFIETYIKENKVTSQYKWVEHRLCHLADAAANNTPPIRDTVDTLKKKIMTAVKAIPVIVNR